MPQVKKEKTTSEDNLQLKAEVWQLGQEYEKIQMQLNVLNQNYKEKIDSMQAQYNQAVLPLQNQLTLIQQEIKSKNEKIINTQ